MLGEFALKSYLRWLSSVEKGLLSVRGELGKRLKDQIDKLEKPSNVLEARVHSSGLWKLLDNRKSCMGDLKWFRKMFRRAASWKATLHGVASRVSVCDESRMSLYLAGKITLEEAVI